MLKSLDFPAPGLAAWHNGCAATAALVHAGHRMEEQLSIVRLSLLAQPGTLLYYREDGRHKIGFVLATSHYGATIWNVVPSLAGGVKLISFQPEGLAWRYIHTTSLVGYDVEETTALPPSEGPVLHGLGLLGSVRVSVGKQVTLLRAAAF